MPYEDDESFFLEVARELSNDQKDEGLWLKAYALENGDNAKAKAHYVRLRVEKLKELSGLEGRQTPNAKADRLPPSTSKCTVAIVPASKTNSSAASIWARLWARNIDFLLCMGLYLVLTTVSLVKIDNIFVILLVAFTVPGAVLVLYDAILISTFGQTVGKSFFGIRVLDDDSNKLSFRVSLRRAIKVWAQGNACYFFFPIATFIAWWQARRGLMAEKISPWDVSTGSSVTQTDIGALRNILATFVGISCLVIAIAVTATVKEINKRGIRETVIPKVDNSASVETPPKQVQELVPFMPIPPNVGVLVDVSGLSENGQLTVQISNGSTNWEVTEITITLTDSEQHVALLNSQRLAPAHSENYSANASLWPGTSKSIQIPVTWNYQRGFLVTTYASGFEIRN